MRLLLNRGHRSPPFRVRARPGHGPASGALTSTEADRRGDELHHSFAHRSATAGSGSTDRSTIAAARPGPQTHPGVLCGAPGRGKTAPACYSDLPDSSSFSLSNAVLSKLSWPLGHQLRHQLRHHRAERLDHARVPSGRHHDAEILMVQPGLESRPVLPCLASKSGARRSSTALPARPPPGAFNAVGTGSRPPRLPDDRPAWSTACRRSRLSPPLTGASITLAPAARPASATPIAVTGEIVLMSTKIRSLLGIGEDAVGPSGRHRDVRQIRQHVDDDVGTTDRLTDAVACPPASASRSALALVRFVPDDVEASLQQVDRHRQAHDSQADHWDARVLQVVGTGHDASQRLWSEWLTVARTATIGLHGNSYEVDAALVGRRVELIFDPFDLTRLQVRWHGRDMGAAVPHRIDRHVHAKARPNRPPIRRRRRPGSTTLRWSRPGTPRNWPTGSATPNCPTQSPPPARTRAEGPSGDREAAIPLRFHPYPVR